MRVPKGEGILDGADGKLTGWRVTRSRGMPEQERTIRQRIMQALAEARYSSRQLADLLDVSEREIEQHLEHVVKTVARDRTRQFLLEPSACRDCGFEFRDRTKLRRPSRCPTCRSEAISPPRFGIESF